VKAVVAWTLLFMEIYDSWRSQQVDDNNLGKNRYTVGILKDSRWKADTKKYIDILSVCNIQVFALIC
jgi:hypothetical protein